MLQQLASPKTVTSGQAAIEPSPVLEFIRNEGSPGPFFIGGGHFTESYSGKIQRVWRPNPCERISQELQTRLPSCLIAASQHGKRESSASAKRFHQQSASPRSRKADSNSVSVGTLARDEPGLLLICLHAVIRAVFLIFIALRYIYEIIKHSDPWRYQEHPLVTRAHS
jgi:hypothetical protein